MASLTEYLRFVVTLIAVVDPFLAVPFFLAFTEKYSLGDRTRLARVIALTVFLVLTVAVFLGEALLHLIGASLPAFRVGGGLVLLLMALAMLNAQAGGVRQSEAEAHEFETGDVSGVVPLAIPLLAGPGAISTSIIAAGRAGLAHQLAIIGCIAIVSPGVVGGSLPSARDCHPAQSHRAQHRDSDSRAAARCDGGADNGGRAEGSVTGARQVKADAVGSPTRGASLVR